MRLSYLEIGKVGSEIERSLAFQPRWLSVCFSDTLFCRSLLNHLDEGEPKTESFFPRLEIRRSIVEDRLSKALERDIRVSLVSHSSSFNLTSCLFPDDFHLLFQLQIFSTLQNHSSSFLSPSYLKAPSTQSLKQNLKRKSCPC